MVRSPLLVDQLEDRCVPSATDPLATAAVPPLMDTTNIVVVEPAPSTFVIDPYLIDPNSPPAPTKPPESGWGDPYSPVPPIANPFWY
jgi:hypothetical protein